MTSESHRAADKLDAALASAGLSRSERRKLIRDARIEFIQEKLDSEPSAPASDSGASLASILSTMKPIGS